MNFEDFVQVGNWFDKQFFRLDGRFASMKAALNLYMQRSGGTIVETGCARMEDDWGAGMSTLAFAEVSRRYGGRLVSIDNDMAHLKTCEAMLEARGLSNHAQLIPSDSVTALANFKDQIDLLYLDSWDHPYCEILDLYGGKEDIQNAIRIVNTMPLEEVRRLHMDLLKPCQEHCLKEFKAAESSLWRGSVVLIDDNGLAGGGKSYDTKPYLISKGWECVIDSQQSLWIRQGK